jgi:hypothetical protein
MVITQAISSLLALRGQNLRDALVAVFGKVSPELANAKGLAEEVLRHPVFSDSALSMKRKWPEWLRKRVELWKLSSAIRAEECFEAIQNIANSTQAEGKEPADDARRQELAADAGRLIAVLSAAPAYAAAERSLGTSNGRQRLTLLRSRQRRALLLRRQICDWQNGRPTSKRPRIALSSRLP